MNITKNPLVSIIIPTYKRSSFLIKTINSVLEQTYSPIEILIVDDNGKGSPFQLDTQNKLQDFIDKGKIKYIIHDVNKNGSAARNTGFHISRGEYINFLDDDDELYPTKIEKQVEKLSSLSLDYGATYCNATIKRQQNITKKVIEISSHFIQNGNLLEDYLMTRCSFGTSAILFRREVIELLNGFDDSYNRHQDLELMTRFFCYYKIASTGNIPLILYDLSKDRSNTLSAKKDYQVKEKYLAQFYNIFKERGIESSVCHHFWFNCSITSLLDRDYKTFFDSSQNCIKFHPHSLPEIIKLVKAFCVGIIKS